MGVTTQRALVTLWSQQVWAIKLLEFLSSHNFFFMLWTQLGQREKHKVLGWAFVLSGGVVCSLKFLALFHVRLHAVVTCLPLCFPPEDENPSERQEEEDNNIKQSLSCVVMWPIFDFWTWTNKDKCHWLKEKAPSWGLFFFFFLKALERSDGSAGYDRLERSCIHCSQGGRVG